MNLPRVEARISRSRRWVSVLRNRRERIDDSLNYFRLLMNSDYDTRNPRKRGLSLGKRENLFKLIQVDRSG